MKRTALLLLAAAAFANAGCYRPFEPVVLEEIGNHEYAFLIPYTGDTTKQTSITNEKYLAANMVLAKQVKIPQQWVPLGYETLGANGEWKPAAKLIRVDGSPVTREWTADAGSGTSDKNEAIWTMTSDQVEWSTGWTCTARVASKDDAVKFLSNYPNGKLEAVLDTEVRAKLQAVFGLKVTDLPMDELRKNSTPVMQSTIKEVEAFFLERGITITNLGISGGYVYKNPSIADKMAEVFKAEQEKSIKLANTEAQEQENKRIRLEAEAKAAAIKVERQAEADAKKLEAEGMKAIADAQAYEIEKAGEDLDAYVKLKEIEVLRKWDGKMPVYNMGQGGPSLILGMPGAK